MMSDCLSLLPDQIYKNDIPPRYQWEGNEGYCGEVSLISAGLYYGQYVSQYDARALATKNAPQSKKQLLLGKNDAYAAAQMHLKAVTWEPENTGMPDQFLAWVKQHVVKGYPVAIGIYMNQYIFYNDTHPDAGDAQYDHIVPVIGIGTIHGLADPNYYPDDLIYFSDNGLYSDPSPPYNFSYAFGPFQATREQANAQAGPIYSLPKTAGSWGIAVTGVLDLNGDTLPVRLKTSVNAEEPPIVDGSDDRPVPRVLTLTVTVSELEPGEQYLLYRYDSFEKVPDSNFNAHASSAADYWNIQICCGSSFEMEEQICSDDIAVYRCVKASAP